MKNALALIAIKEACQVLPRVGELNTIDNVAKYVGATKMELIKFIDENYDMFTFRDIKRGRAVKKVIEAVYLTVAEKPGTLEWVRAKALDCMNIIRLNKEDYYGYIMGYDLLIDKGPQAYLNLQGKVLRIANTLQLKGPGWSYVAGGLGDSYTVKCKGYQVTEADIPRIQALGYDIVYSDPF